MSLLYFDGFDIQTAVPVADFNMSTTDESFYWKFNPLSRGTFTTGYDTGQAMFVQLTRPLYHTFNIDTHQIRMGWFGRGVVSSAGQTGGREMLRISGAGIGAENSYSLIAFGDGSMAINQHKPGSTGYGTTIDYNDAEDLYSTVYANYEFYANFTTGETWLKRNGVEILSGTGEPLTDNPETVFLGDVILASGIGSYHWDNVFDHLWVTDGEGFDTDGVKAVSVVATQDLYESTAGFRGSLTVGGERFLTNPLSAAISSQNAITSGNPPKNVANTTNFYFMKDPRDGTPWTDNKFDDVTHWGVCYGRDTGTTKMRLVATCLSYLVFENGLGYVRYEQADAVTQFSGPWAKTDTSKSYAWHVRSVPRANIEYVSDADYLTLAGPGCIIFERNPDRSDDDAPLLDLGITFAEEFREDYKDWVRVDGGTSFETFFNAGYGVYAEGDKQFQNNYVVVNYKNLPTGGAYIQGLWDYAFDSDTGRWSMKQQVYKSEDGYTHRERKLKIRGNGRALQIRITNHGDRPFQINGWSMFITSDGRV